MSSPWAFPFVLINHLLTLWALWNTHQREKAKAAVELFLPLVMPPGRFSGLLPLSMGLFLLEWLWGLFFFGLKHLWRRQNEKLPKMADYDFSFLNLYQFSPILYHTPFGEEISSPNSSFSVSPLEAFAIFYFFLLMLWIIFIQTFFCFMWWWTSRLICALSICLFNPIDSWVLMV